MLANVVWERGRLCSSEGESAAVQQNSQSVCSLFVCVISSGSAERMIDGDTDYVVGSDVNCR